VTSHSFERWYTDGNGKRFRAVISILDDGNQLEAALQRLANKARSRPNGETSVCGGLVTATVEEVL
jgi:hypothetical protein